MSFKKITVVTILENGVNFESCSSSGVGTTWDRSQLRLPAPVEDPRCRHAAPVIQVNRVEIYFVIVHNQRSDSYLMLRHYSSSLNMYTGDDASSFRRRSSDIRGRLSSCGWKSCNTRNSSSSGPTTNWRHPIRSNVNPAAIQPQSSLNPSEPQASVHRSLKPRSIAASIHQSPEFPSIGASTSIRLGHLLAPSGLCLGLFWDSFWPHPGHLELKKRAFLVHIKTHFVPSDISLLP